MRSEDFSSAWVWEEHNEEGISNEELETDGE